MDKSWKKLSSKIVLENPWFKIRQDKVIRPDGQKGEYNIMETPPAVFIVAISDDQEVLLVEQYRYPTEMSSWEVPGGRSDNEDLLQAAKRELKEETGFEAKDWDKAGEFQTMNGISNEISHVFMAKDLKQTDQSKKEEEGISKVKQIPFKEVLNLIKSGEITDGQTIASLAQAALFLGLI